MASGAVAVAVSILAVLFYWHLLASQDQGRDQVVSGVEKRAAQLAGAVANRMGVSVRNVDFSLRQMRAGFGIDQARFNAIAESLLSAYPERSKVRLSFADASGKQVYPAVTPQDRREISGSEIFRSHLESGDHLYIGRPIVEEQSGEWMIQFSRPLIRADRFEGVAVLTLSLAYVSELLSVIDLPAGDSISLLDADRAYLARNRDFQQVVGTKLAAGAAPGMDAAPSGVVRRAVSGEAERIVAWHRVPDTRLVASVDLDLGVALAPIEAHFRQERVSAGILCTLLILSVLAVFALSASLARRQREVVRSEERFRGLTHLSTDGYWEQDEEHRFTLLEGRQRPYPEGVAIGKTLWDWPAINISEDDWRAHRQLRDARRAFRDLELRWVGAEGALHAVSVSGEPVFDEAGVFRGYQGTSSDISERKLSEAIVEGQKHVLEMIVMGAPLGEVLDTLSRMIEGQAPGMRASVLLLDPDGAHLRHGAAPSLPEEYTRAIDGIATGEGGGCCGTAVYRREMVIVEDIATDPLWVAFRELALRHNLRACWSTPIFDADGSVLGTFAMYYPRPGRPPDQHRWLIDAAVHLAATAIARRRKEAELRDSEARARALAERLQIGQEAAGMMVLEWRIADDHVDWGDAEERLRGPRPASGKYPVYKDQVHPDDQQYFIDMRARGMLSSKSQTGEYRFIRTDGEMRWLRSHNKTMPEPSGEVKRMLFAIYDITSLKNSELAQQKLEAQLRQAQKMEALGTLVGGIAHDFNNILAAILGNVEFARMDTGPGHPAQESLAEIEESAKRASHLVRQILSYSRRKPQELRKVDLREVLGDAVKLLRASLPARIELAMTIASDQTVVLADATQIHQVMMNLGTNALHAIGNEKGRFEFSLGSVTIDESGEQASLSPGRYVHLRVTDTGIGMDAATLERIFDPFFTTKAPGQGTGLGLSVVSGIIKSHNGVISVSSEPGKGSTFEIYFPAVDAGAKQPEKASAAGPHFQPQSGEGARVLLVDDEQKLVALAERFLGGIGYQVRGFTSPVQALAAFRASPADFDLLVTDFNMPEVSGLDIAKEVLQRRPDLPVILASGYLTDELQAQSLELGIREVIYKPYSNEELAAVLARLGKKALAGV